MVLVSYTPYNHISLLQTKFRYRKGYEARCMGLEAMPLDQHIEERHREREPCLKIRPLAMQDFLEVADERQHRQDRLHQHAIFPLAPLTEFQVGGIALRGMEGSITQDNHPPIDLLNQPLKGVIRHIGGCTRPPLRIPVIPATQSGAKLPPNPKEACHPIRTKAAPHRSPIGAQRRLG